MVLRDMVCTSCGELVRDVFAEARHSGQCASCGCERTFVDACRGGLKNRWRCLDFPTWRENPDFYAGQTSHSVEVVEQDESPAMHLDGTPIHGKPRFADEDAASERRDRETHRIKTEAGMTPLYLDRKGI